MNTSYIDTNKEKCPNKVKEFVERLSTEGNSMVIDRYDLHIRIKDDSCVEIESYKLDQVQKDELAKRIEEMLMFQKTLDDDDYKLRKHSEPIKIKFSD